MSVKPTKPENEFQAKYEALVRIEEPKPPRNPRVVEWEAKALLARPNRLFALRWWACLLGASNGKGLPPLYDAYGPREYALVRQIIDLQSGEPFNLDDIFLAGGAMRVLDPRFVASRIGYNFFAEMLRFCPGGEGANSVTAEVILNGTPQLYYERRYDPAMHFKLPWRLRQQTRLMTGNLERLPWKLKDIDGHYAHVSKSDPAMIAFTPSPEYGERDRVTTVKPGRYLTKFYNDLHPDEVRRLQATMGTLELKFAVTADEIEDVYVRGPESCMAHPASHFESSEHPVRVYGNSDLQLAYIENAVGKPSARALVWPERKVYGRVYGDGDRLRSRLEAQGYSEGSLRGAKIRRIEDEERDRVLVMPYIDGCQNFGFVDKEWLTIGGKLPAGSTDGLIDLEEYATECAGCNELFANDSTTYVVDSDESYCHDCLDDHTSCCDRCAERFVGDGVEVYVRTTAQRWCERCSDRHVVICDGSGVTFSRGTGHTLRNGNRWCEAYFTEHGIRCIDGHNYDKDDPDRPPARSEMPIPTISLPVTVLDIASDLRTKLYGDGRSPVSVGQHNSPIGRSSTFIEYAEFIAQVRVPDVKEAV